MQRQTALVGAVVLAAVLAVGAAGVAAAGGNASADAQPNKTIQVSASGQVQATADRAVVQVAVVSSGDDIEAVRSNLVENVSSMRDALTDMGINESQIQTAHYDISSQERYGREEPGEPKYRAIHSFAITVNDTDSVGKVIDTAVTNGASEIDGVQFILSEEKRNRLKETALQKAMDAARGKAGAVASRADLIVAGVDQIRTSEFSSSPYEMERVAFAADAGGGTSINSGPVTVTASVSVVYEAQPQSSN